MHSSTRRTRRHVEEFCSTSLPKQITDIYLLRHGQVLQIGLLQTRLFVYVPSSLSPTGPHSPPTPMTLPGRRCTGVTLTERLEMVGTLRPMQRGGRNSNAIQRGPTHHPGTFRLRVRFSLRPLKFKDLDRHNTGSGGHRCRSGARFKT